MRTLFACLAGAVVLVGAVSLADAKPRVNKKRADKRIARISTKLESRRAQRLLQAQLKMPITLNLQHTPLDEALDDFRQLSSINIVPDYKALQDAGVSLKQPIFLQVEKISVQSALSLLVRQADLAWVIRDGVILLTTEARAKGKLRQVTYPVANIIAPFEDCAEPVVQNDEEVSQDRPKRQTAEARLIDMITSAIAPSSWDAAGGSCTIQYYPLGMALVVNQTQDVHEEIRDLLEALRRLQEMQVVLEVRLADVFESFIEDACAEMDSAPSKDALFVLTPVQAKRMLERVQQDCHCNIMQAPKVTAFNGQSISVNITDQHCIITDFEVIKETDQTVVRPKTEKVPVGMSLSLEPVVSADRASIRVALKLDLSTLGTPGICIPVTTHLQRTSADGNDVDVPVQNFIQLTKHQRRSIEHKLSIPVGHTAVLDAGKHLVEYRSEHSVPLLSYLPYVSRLFRTVGYGRECRQTLLLVTARLIEVTTEDVTVRGLPQR